MTFHEDVVQLEACQEAVDFLANNDIVWFWENNTDPTWTGWVLSQVNLDRATAITIGIEIAERVAHLNKDEYSHKYIPLVEAWHKDKPKDKGVGLLDEFAPREGPTNLAGTVCRRLAKMTDPKWTDKEVVQILLSLRGAAIDAVSHDAFWKGDQAAQVAAEIAAQDKIIHKYITSADIAKLWSERNA